MFDYNEVKRQVAEAVNTYDGDYDVDGIVDEIRDTTDYDDVDDIPSDEWARIVMNHDDA